MRIGAIHYFKASLLQRSVLLVILSLSSFFSSSASGSTSGLDITGTTNSGVSPSAACPTNVNQGQSDFQQTGNGSFFAVTSGGSNCNPGGGNTPPVISFSNSSQTQNLQSQPGSVYTETTARNLVTATDAQDGDLTLAIQVSASTDLAGTSSLNFPVDVSIERTFYVQYSVTDSGGLSDSDTRTVIVTTIIPDSVSVDSPNHSQFNSQNDSNVTIDGSCSHNNETVTYSISGTGISGSSLCLENSWNVAGLDLSNVNPATANISISATHRTASDSRAYSFDNVAPSLSLSQSSYTISQGSLFGDAQARAFIASATDNRDGGNLSNSVVITGLPSDTNIAPANYSVGFSLTDAAGNTVSTSLDLFVDMTDAVAIDTPAAGSLEAFQLNTLVVGGTCSHPGSPVSFSFTSTSITGSASCETNNRWTSTPQNLSSFIGSSLSVVANHRSASDTQIYSINRDYSIQMLDPVNGTIGISTQPTFDWELFGPNGQPFSASNLRFEYNLKRDNINSAAAGSTALSFFDFGTASQLVEGSEYTLSIKAFINDVEEADALFTFRTRSVNVPTLSLASNPTIGGQTEILLSAAQGELDSTAIFFEVDGNNGLTEVARSSVNFDGTVSVVIQISDSTEANEFTYQAVLERHDGQDVRRGDLSNQVTYQYDPSLALEAPFIEEDDQDPATGKIKWRSIAGATFYRVWRRVGNELCSPAAGATCYQTIKPFTLIETINDTSSQTIRFQDLNTDNFNIQPAGAGVSYFVTAHNNNETSQRSNSLSFLDSLQVRDFQDNQPRLVYIKQAYNATVYACDAPAGYALDNSADLIASIQLDTRPTASDCSAFNFDQNSTQILPQRFDSLARVTRPAQEIANCIPVAEITNLRPETNYCIATCFNDPSGNGLVCPENENVFTNPDGQAPDFNGITSLVAGADGTSLVASWNLAIGDVPDEVIEYQVRCTDRFSQGEPDFTDVGAVVAENNQTSIRLSELNTGTNYACNVTAVDRYNNRNGAEVYLTESTLDNRPRINSSSLNLVLDGRTQTASRVGELCVEVEDRNMDTGDRVSVSGLSFDSLNSSGSSTDSSRSMTAVDLQSLLVQNANVFYSLGTEPSRQDCFTLDLGRILSVNDLKGLQYAVQVTDLEGNEGRSTGVTQFDSELSIGTNRFGNSLSEGCSLTAQSSQQNSSVWMIAALLLSGLVSLIFSSRKNELSQD